MALRNQGFPEDGHQKKVEWIDFIPGVTENGKPFFIVVGR